MTSEARLAQLEDERAIRRLTAVYGEAVGRLDAHAAASTYVEDGRVSILGRETVGRVAIEAGMRASFEAHALLQFAAHGGLIDIAGDRATARWSTVEFAVRHGSEDIHCILGRYEDDLVRQPDGWRFRRRVFTLASRARLAPDKLQLNADFARRLVGDVSDS
ncbi:nuclear transport factor 2 family protein [Caulobacter soli]|uniref:nuclear transport factor 2 family protein n=1 Tax=Caulobacter soli TaxID=2708539 RepID=UPI0013E9EBCD|nr:nuclear transport factor 2 family protein [Caulobacter soli]